MGIVSDILASASYGQRTDLENPALWLVNALGGGTTTRAGERVSPDRAMTMPALLATVRNVSEDIAKVPVEERQKRGPDRRGSDPVPDGAAGALLDGDFNPWTLSFTGRQALTQWALLWRAGYAEIERDGVGRPIALWPIHPSRARLVWIDGGLYLEVHQQDLRATGAPLDVYHIPYADVLHIRGFGDDIEGYSLVMMAAESIGLGIAAQMFGASFFGNGAHASVVISWPENVSPPGDSTIRKIKKQWSKAHGRHALEPRVLLDGAKVTQLTIPPEQAQFIETRKFQTVEFCRLLRMPPHKVQDLERATFSNIEHLAIEYVTDCLLPWYIRWEKECERKLLTPNERRKGRYLKHNVNGLLRGDFASRTAGYRTLISSMVMEPNEARDLEDMNPSEAPGANELWTQGAMVPMRLAAEGKTSTTSPGTSPSPPAPEDPEASERADAEAFRPMLRYEAVRLVQKEALASARAAKRLPAQRDYGLWARRFAGEHREDMAEAFRPYLLSRDNSQADLGAMLDSWQRRFEARRGAEFQIDGEADALVADVERAVAEARK